MVQSMPIKKTLAIACALAAAATMPTTTVHASNLVLEEIVVTSRKREESLTDVPAAVQAFSETMLQDAHVERASDFLSLTPNVMFLDIQDAGSAFLTIRGMTSNRNTEQSVAVVYDGVLTTSPNALTQELFDVQQIEVLKGPQGALYGRNAIGGAILITTKQPTNEGEGKFTIGAGNADRIKVQGAYSGAIIEDELFYRVAGSFLDHNGYHTNVTLNEEVDFFKDESGRVQLMWQPSDTFAMDVRYNKSRMKSGAINFKVTSRFHDGIPANCSPSTADPRPCDIVGDANLTVDDNKLDSNILGLSTKDLQGASVKLDWDLGWATLTSTSAWDEVDVYWAGDTPAVFFPGADTPYGPERQFTNSQWSTSQAYSQELRLTGADEESLRWIVGAYYVNNDRAVASTFGLDTHGYVVDNGFYPIPGGFDFTKVNPTLGFAKDKQQIEAWAVFGQLAYDVSDEIELAVAMRYDEDERTITTLTPAQFIHPIAAAEGQFEGKDSTQVFDKLQPKISARWQPNGDWTFYTSWGVGFRAGGFNQTGIATAMLDGYDSISDARKIQLPENLSDQYEQEETEDIEIGFKAKLLDGSMRLNASIFNTEVQDKQFFIFALTDSGLSAQTLLNIDEVTLTGLEMDFYYRTPIEGLDVFGAYGHIKSEIDEYTANADAAHLTDGSHAPYVPVYTGNLGAQYTVPTFIEGVNLVARLDYQRIGKTYWEPEELSSRDPVNLLNGRLAIESEDGSWVLSAWGKNLNDTQYNAERDGPYGFAHPGALRSWGIEFSIDL
ncbi:TonB-dependent receptor [Pseudomaricurvus alkylphenolicus]|uniref:TonB-dependent receptor n=1 Tax=Pseudomaricurvus alkylphenolicus TaxID=1306991 RepID=UPI0014226395|nr:TonB-dependent receptor [Pseudomaricurvus alkylphenolicus]NIB40813.1 TonB-dependent receptor [Pseudomaricurvus alkylphenolicus]